MKYLHLFETKESHDAAYKGSGYSEPWTAYIKGNNNTSYNKPTIILYNDGSVKKYVGISTIEADTFENKENIKAATIGYSVKAIGSYAFMNCKNLILINIPYSVKTIGKYAFGNCVKLNSKRINSQIAYLLPPSINYIGYAAFIGCTSLTNLWLPTGITAIEENTFSSCEQLRTIILPSTLTEIGFYAFHDCINLTNIIVPNSVTKILEGAFNDCTKLKNITIGKSANYIDNHAFRACESLTTITCLASKAPELGDEPFLNISSTGTLHYPNGSDYSTWIAQLPSTWAAVADA